MADPPTGLTALRALGEERGLLASLGHEPVVPAATARRLCAGARERLSARDYPFAAAAFALTTPGSCGVPSAELSAWTDHLAGQVRTDDIDPGSLALQLEVAGSTPGPAAALGPVATGALARWSAQGSPGLSHDLLGVARILAWSRGRPGAVPLPTETREHLRQSAVRNLLLGGAVPDDYRTDDMLALLGGQLLRSVLTGQRQQQVAARTGNFVATSTSWEYREDGTDGPLLTLGLSPAGRLDLPPQASAAVAGWAAYPGLTTMIGQRAGDCDLVARGDAADAAALRRYRDGPPVPAIVNAVALDLRATQDCDRPSAVASAGLDRAWVTAAAGAFFAADRYPDDARPTSLYQALSLAQALCTVANPPIAWAPGPGGPGPTWTT